MTELEKLYSELRDRTADEARLIPYDESMREVLTLGNAYLIAASFLKRAYQLGQSTQLEAAIEAVEGEASDDHCTGCDACGWNRHRKLMNDSETEICVDCDNVKCVDYGKAGEHRFCAYPKVCHGGHAESPQKPEPAVNTMCACLNRCKCGSYRGTHATENGSKTPCSVCPTPSPDTGWWNEENKLMKFKSIDHRSGTINGSSQAYDEMWDYLDIKLSKAHHAGRVEQAKLDREAHDKAVMGDISGWKDDELHSAIDKVRLASHFALERVAPKERLE